MKTKLKSTALLVAGCVLSLNSVLLLSSCGGSGSKSGSDSTASTGGDENALVGAGSTFVYPLFGKMFAEYGKTHPIKVNYQSIGLGGGIQQLTSKTVDFGGSDAPLNDEQTKKIGVPVLHIPMASGAMWFLITCPELPNR
jgi:phosphate transport system substrate-binding protein